MGCLYDGGAYLYFHLPQFGSFSEDMFHLRRDKTIIHFLLQGFPWTWDHQIRLKLGLAKILFPPLVRVLKANLSDGSRCSFAPTSSHVRPRISDDSVQARARIVKVGHRAIKDVDFIVWYVFPILSFLPNHTSPFFIFFVMIRPIRNIFFSVQCFDARIIQKLGQGLRRARRRFPSRQWDGINLYLWHPNL